MSEVTPRFKTEKPLPHQTAPSESPEDRTWKQAVRKRDGNRCQRCNYFDPHNDAHHIASRKQRPDLIHDVSNGVTLCRTCHRWVHLWPAKAKELGFVSGERYELNRSQ